MSTVERFNRRVRSAESGCTEWIGALGEDGYGRFWAHGRMWLAHRFAWINERGPIAEGLQVDHLCRNRRCVNLDHLEPVTASENVRRSGAPDVCRALARSKSERTHCRRGHEFTPENTYLRPNRPSRNRVCRACRRLREGHAS